MGLFSFIKDAGEKLTGKDDKERSENVKKSLADAKLNPHNVDVNVEQEKVVLKGDVEDKNIFEKMTLMVGNIAGISEVENQLTVKGEKIEKEEEQPKFYTVKQGDTLSKIAQEIYGDPMKYKELFAENQPMLKKPELIYPGQVLRIPDLD